MLLRVGDKVRCLVEGRRYGQIGVVVNIVDGVVFVDFDGQNVTKQSRYAVFYVPIVELERVSQKCLTCGSVFSEYHDCEPLL